jgi:hypothetical protein
VITVITGSAGMLLCQFNQALPINMPVKKSGFIPEQSFTQDGGYTT